MAVITNDRPTRIALHGLSGLRILWGGLSGQIGFALVVVILAVAVFGPFFAPYPPNAISVGDPVSSPSMAHWMGTDMLGRDVFSRFLNGGRSIILIPVISVIVSGAIGTALGLWSGYVGGILDGVVTRLVDVFYSVPPLLLGMLFVTAFGSSAPVLVAMVVLIFMPRTLRVVRGATQTVISQDYILSAKARGEPTFAILWHEILPNISGTLLAESAIRLVYAIALIATFNFLGIGVQPPASDWGLMVSENRIIIAQVPLASLGPALGIAVLAIGVNLSADQIALHLARNVLRESRL